jgi:hypothetical protein
MRTLGTRRTVLVAGAAAMAAVALAGCSAGQVAETSLKRPSNMGVNVDNANRSVLIRNLAVPYNDPAGYPVDQPAPLQLALFNQTTDEVRVTVTSSKPADGTTVAGALTGTSVSLSGPADSASPAPTDSATPSEAPAQPAVITLAPQGTASFLPGDPQSLQISGLPKELAPGGSVYVTFTFSNGTAPLTVPAPVGVPASPASRAPGIPDENVEE